MKVYEVCIKPTSDFVTPLQGDCLFGHICWQIAHDPELVGEIDQILSDYDKSPFCIVADPVMKFKAEGEDYFVFPKAFAPAGTSNIPATASFEQRKEEYDRRKAAKKAKWMLVSKTKKLSTNNFAKLSDIKELGLESDWKPSYEYRQSHNTIDRTTGTTGTSAAFAPFAVNGIAWNSNLEMAVFVGVRDDISKTGIKTALQRIGKFGYGADASTGKGRFEVVEMNEIDLNQFAVNDANALYTLSACVPEKEIYRKVYFEPFIRSGRHGDAKANSEFPFKQPVLKAAAGAVLVPNNVADIKQTYIGKAVKDVSMFKETVEQGYSLVIPMKVENVK